MAAQNLPKPAYDYYRAGANASVTLIDNVDAFKKIHLKTNVFSDKAKPVSLDTVIMGQKVKTPICIASTAFHKMATKEGELATARAA